MSDINFRLHCRLALRKSAAGAAAAAGAGASAAVIGKELWSLLKGGGKALAGWSKDVASAAASNLKDSAKVALPAVSLMSAWLAYKMLSPKAVADNVHEYATNAIEKETLVQSMRDLEEQKLKNKMKSGRAITVHDQFL